MFICTKKQIQKVAKLKLCFDNSEQDTEIEIKRGILVRVVFIKNESKNEVLGRVIEVRDNMMILDASYTYNGDIIGVIYSAIREIEEISEDQGIHLSQKVDNINEQVTTNSETLNQIKSSLQWDDM